MDRRTSPVIILYSEFFKGPGGVETALIVSYDGAQREKELRNTDARVECHIVDHGAN